MRSASFVASLLVASGIGIAAGCSSPGPTDTGGGPSFSKTVMPLLQSTCSTNQGVTCHGDPSVTTNTVNGMANQPRPYFGPFIPQPPDAATIQTVYSGLVGVHASEAPSYVYVDTSGSLSNSYMWHKLNDDLSGIQCTSQVTSPPCGLKMPNDTTPLTSGQLQTFHDWIAAGAPNN